MKMLVLQGEGEYDRYMSKMLRKLKQPHATRASCYIMHPGHTWIMKAQNLYTRDLGAMGKGSPRSQVTVSSLLCSLYKACPFPKIPASLSLLLLVSHHLLT